MKLKFLACAALAAAGLIATVAATPALAGSVDTYVSASGSDGNTCTFTNPCQTFGRAVSQTSDLGTVHCLGSDGNGGSGISITQNITIDCSNSATSGVGGITVNSPAIQVTLIGLTVSTFIMFEQGGSLRVIDCKFIFSNPAILFEPTSDAKLEIVNTDFLAAQTAIAFTSGNGGAGPSGNVTATLKNINITEASNAGININTGGTVTAALKNVTITNNGGAGIRANSANGAITLDIVDSVINSNRGGGVNALGSGQNNMVSISHSTIGANGGAGVQANGATAAVMVDTTLLDSNTGGAVSAINGGHVVSYGNNRIVGSSGTGFSSTVGTQ